MEQRNLRYANTTTNRQTSYIHGNTVRVNNPVREVPQVPHVVRETVKKQKKARHMNLPYVIFLCSAMIVLGITLIGYLQDQSKLTVSRKNVAVLESRLNNLRLENDERLERIETALDMNEIRRIAIEELGMTYAKEGQVVIISDEGSDYVRQFAQLPN
jgi:Tfp pilus assembly protein PilN